MAQDTLADTHQREALHSWRWRIFSSSVWILAAFSIFTSIKERGIWYDEIYTIYVTRHELGLGHAFQDYWMSDNHPPLYYFLSWVGGFFGEGYIARRLLNMALFVAASGGFLAVARATLIRPAVIVIFAMAVISYGAFLGYAALLRSYFLSLLLSALLSLLLTALASAREWRDHIGLLGLTAFVALLGANTHFVTTLMTGCLVGSFALRYVLERKPGHFRGMVLVGLVAFVPFLAYLSIAFGTIEANTRNFWVQPGLRTGASTIFNHGAGILAGFPPVTLAGILGLCLLVKDAAHARVMDARLRDILTLAAGLFLFAVLLLAVHAWRPVIADYYLVSLVGPITLCLAIGAARTLEALGGPVRGIVYAGLLAWFSFNLYLNDRAVAGAPTIKQAAVFIRHQIDRCPGTVVYADTFPQSLLIALPPKENGIVTLSVYPRVAQIYGFPVAPAASRTVSETCPTLFWTAHHAARETPGQTLQRLRRDGYPISNLERHELGAGVVNVARPQR